MLKPFSDLIGKTLTAVTVNEADDTITFHVDDGSVYKMYHEQDCCESVVIEDVSGDIQDLIGSPILVAEERVSDKFEGYTPHPYDDSNTWTFYTLRTNKGTVDVRWHGSSNGYYSEGVDFRIVRDANGKEYGLWDY